MSSGREDIDVLMLGTGRPFALEVLDPRKEPSLDALKEIESAINNKNGPVQVRNLRFVTKEQLKLIKEGEESKIKSYRAKVWFTKPMSNDELDKITAAASGKGGLTIHQKTPIRVLHRRASKVRPRIVHSLRWERIDDHNIYLHLDTQAGTYIKEFIHGDLGRTEPNIASLAKCEADITELDVLEVQLDGWA